MHSTHTCLPLRSTGRYAVSEYEFPKKLVVWGKAEGFMTSTTFMFMEHPARPNHTIVRQVSRAFSLSFTCCVRFCCCIQLSGLLGRSTM